MECAALLLKTVLPVLLITGLSVLVMHRGLTLIFGMCIFRYPGSPAQGRLFCLSGRGDHHAPGGFSKENGNLLEEIRSESI